MIRISVSTYIVFCLMLCGQTNGMFIRVIRQNSFNQQPWRQLGTQIPAQRMHRMVTGGTIAVGITGTLTAKKLFDDLQEMKKDLEECHQHLENNNEKMISLCQNLCFKNALATGDVETIQNYLDSPEIMEHIDDQVLYDALFFTAHNKPEIYTILLQHPRAQKIADIQEFKIVLAGIVSVIS